MGRMRRSGDSAPIELHHMACAAYDIAASQSAENTGLGLSLMNQCRFLQLDMYTSLEQVGSSQFGIANVHAWPCHK